MNSEHIKMTIVSAAGIAVGLWAWFAFVRPALGSMVGTKSVL